MKNKKIYPIVFSVDDNYVLPLLVSIQSLKKRFKKNKKIYVFYDKLTDENKNLIKKFSDKKTEIILYCVANEIKNNNFYTVSIFTVAMYYRFFIPHLLNQYDKVLYLDCDILITNSLEKLFDLDISTKCIAAVHDDGVIDETHINSGVILFNIKRCLQFNFTQKCLDFINTHSNLSYPDQETINCVCVNEIYYLNKGYNFQIAHLFENEPKLMGEIKLEKISKILRIKKREIFIVHFLTCKPWNSNMYYLPYGTIFYVPLSYLWWKEALNLEKYGVRLDKKYMPKKDSFSLKIKKMCLKIFGKAKYDKIKSIFKKNTTNVKDDKK